MTREDQGFWRVLNGPQELGRGAVFWCLFVFVRSAFRVPLCRFSVALSNLASFCLYVPMGLGLALLWGYNGVLSFGQGAFFAVAGYVYGIIAGNLIDMPRGDFIGGSRRGRCLRGYGGGIRIFRVLRSSKQLDHSVAAARPVANTGNVYGADSGLSMACGECPAWGLQRYDQCPLSSNWISGFWRFSLGFYYLVVALMLITYLGLRLLVNSHYGHVVAGIRDDIERTRMLGYNVALIQIQVFVLAAALAALSGILYVSWGNYINPSSMGSWPRRFQ